MFKDFIRQASPSVLSEMMMTVNEDYRILIAQEIMNRGQLQDSKVSVWFEIMDDVWIHRLVSFEVAEELAKNCELECHHCWGIIDDVHQYILFKGCCSQICQFNQEEIANETC